MRIISGLLAVLLLGWVLGIGEIFEWAGFFLLFGVIIMLLDIARG